MLLLLLLVPLGVDAGNGGCGGAGGSVGVAVDAAAGGGGVFFATPTHMVWAQPRALTRDKHAAATREQKASALSGAPHVRTACDCRHRDAALLQSLQGALR